MTFGPPIFHATFRGHRRRLREEAFTLVETMATICILMLMVTLGAGVFQSLASTSRMTAAQMLVGAVEEARAEAMRSGKVSMIAFRKKEDDMGLEAWREFAVLKHEMMSQGEACYLDWRSIPNGIVLWSGMPAGTSAGTNVVTLPPKTCREYSIPNLSDPNESPDMIVGMIFGDLGEVIYPSAQATVAADGAATPAVPGPYYLAVAEEQQVNASANLAPKNLQLIEIRPASGRAQLLP